MANSFSGRRAQAVIATVAVPATAPDSTTEPKNRQSNSGIWVNVSSVSQWSFLTNHARCLVLIAHDPGLRLRDIAATLDITERSAHGIVTNLAEAGYVLKEKEGRRNRYQIQAHLPLGEGIGRERTIGEVLDLLVDANTANRRRKSGK